MTEREQAKTQETRQTQVNRKQTTLQLLLFSVVGVINTAVDIAVYWVLIQLSVYYALANVISYAAGMLNSYLWNNYLTFRKASGQAEKDKKKRTAGKISRFIIWNGITLLLSSCIIAFMIEILDWSELWSKLAATAIILVVQFTGMKKWVFRE